MDLSDLDKIADAVDKKAKKRVRRPRKGPKAPPPGSASQALYPAGIPVDDNGDPLPDATFDPEEFASKGIPFDLESAHLMKRGNEALANRAHGVADKFPAHGPTKFGLLKKQFPTSSVRFMQIAPVKDENIPPRSIESFDHYTDMIAYLRDIHWRGDKVKYLWAVFDERNKQWGQDLIELQADPDFQKKKFGDAPAYEENPMPPQQPPPYYPYGYPSPGYGYPPGFGAPPNGGIHPPPNGGWSYPGYGAPPVQQPQQQQPPPLPPPQPLPIFHPPPGMDPVLAELFRNTMESNRQLMSEMAAMRAQQYQQQYQQQQQQQPPPWGWPMPPGWLPPPPPAPVPVVVQEKPKSAIDVLNEMTAQVATTVATAKKMANEVGYVDPRLQPLQTNPVEPVGPEDFPVPMKTVNGVTTVANPDGTLGYPMALNAEPIAKLFGMGLSQLKDLAFGVFEKKNESDEKALALHKQKLSMDAEADAIKVQRMAQVQQMTERELAMRRHYGIETAPVPPPTPPVPTPPPPPPPEIVEVPPEPEPEIVEAPPESEPEVIETAETEPPAEIVETAKTELPAQN